MQRHAVSVQGQGQSRHDGITAATAAHKLLSLQAPSVAPLVDTSGAAVAVAAAAVAVTAVAIVGMCARVLVRPWGCG
jgi:hypothetical protein